jgi:acetolactate synthase I/II/III large subunit
MTEIEASAVSLTGAQAVVASLTGAGTEVCFMNPGTSEMHLVRALDTVPEMRGVLALFEGVATGAADGYARMAGKPAAVLLHLGPGLSNGLANLHNARRAHTPLLCIVGAHATGHVRHDAPLQSDIEALARTVSGFVHTSGSARGAADDAMRALAATRADGGQVATLIIPADVAWETGAAVAPPRAAIELPEVSKAALDAAAHELALGEQTMLLLGGKALTERGLHAADRVARATGARLLAETFPARMEAGAGVPAVDRLAYLDELASGQLAGTRRLILVGARAPVSFFAYAGRNGDLVPDGCRVLELADAGQNAEAALEELAARLAPDTPARPSTPRPPAEDTGPLTLQNLASVIASTLPARAIVVDEANTSGIFLPQELAGAPQHTLLTLTGGAIGQGLPVATGAAIATPARPVLAIQADGSAMYTIQALWTQARERLNVTTVILSNAAYAILRMELARTTGGPAGDCSARMLDLADPPLNFTEMAAGLGVPARRVTTAEELRGALHDAYAELGPHLIEALVPALM